MVNELWFFLLISILFIAGSVWLILPSPAQRRKQKMRSRAYRIGLKVRKLTPEATVTPEYPSRLYYYKLLPPSLSAVGSNCSRKVEGFSSNINSIEVDEELKGVMLSADNLNHLNVELLLMFNTVGVLWDEIGEVEDVTQILCVINEVLKILAKRESE